MKPESFLGITLELVEILEAPGAYPADARVGRFFRKRHYLGSRDRTLVGGAAYAWLRYFHRARARWTAWLEERALSLPSIQGANARRGFLLADVLTLARDGLLPWSFEETLAAAQASGAGGFPSDWVLAGGWPREPAARLAAELSLPLWLTARLLAERGLAEAKELGLSLLGPAPVDLRVNRRKIGRETAQEALARETRREVTLTRWSPLGLRLGGRVDLRGTAAWRSGWIEVEDEGSQALALALEPEPGMTIVDACAGAGGKTLALADLVLGAGDPGGSRLIACDVEPRKLENLSRRAQAAGVEPWIEVVPISHQGPLPDRLPAADLVLADVPCSGLGTLRRNPDLKRRHGPEDIAAFARSQRAILERFAPLVKVGGRLAYATCSILAAENEEVADAFAGDHPEFEACPSGWADRTLPPGCAAAHRLRLDPVRSGTDGFFLGLWRKRG